MKLILGTMTFGQQANLKQSKEMVKAFLNRGYSEIDSAFVYNDGKTEEYLGEILKALAEEDIHLATKVNPKVTGTLDRKSIEDQMNLSLKRLQRDSVDILYLHFPDPKTPLEVTLETCSELAAKGKIKELGLSNFPAWQVANIYRLCEANQWIKPTLYEGLYNTISRKSEKELFPALKEFQIRMNAFNPLAGGLLTGKYAQQEKAPEEGRFALRQSYKTRYWKTPLLEGANTIAQSAWEHDLEPAETAIRWLAYHSLLQENPESGIIIGASKIEQLHQNLDAVEKGPLPEELVNQMQKISEKTLSESPDYFRIFKG